MPLKELAWLEGRLTIWLETIRKITYHQRRHFGSGEYGTDQHECVQERKCPLCLGGKQVLRAKFSLPFEVVLKTVILRHSYVLSSHNDRMAALPCEIWLLVRNTSASAILQVCTALVRFLAFFSNQKCVDINWSTS